MLRRHLNVLYNALVRPRALGRLAVIALLASGCATANVWPGAPYKRDHVYLYGRFTYTGLSMTFAIRCRDGAVYKVDFMDRDQVQMIELVPSICQLDKIEYGSSANGQLVPFRMLRNEILDPGGLYYVGDYSVTGASRTEFKVFYTEVHQRWRMNHAHDDYARSTAEMRQLFPAFAATPTEDRVAH
jgi:hypothetical protein